MLKLPAVLSSKDLKKGWKLQQKQQNWKSGTNKSTLECCLSGKILWSKYIQNKKQENTKNKKKTYKNIVWNLIYINSIPNYRESKEKQPYRRINKKYKYICQW